MANTSRQVSGSPHGKPPQGGRSGFTFPLVLGFMLVSFLSLLGMVQLAQGQAQHLQVVRAYYQSQIQWSLVRAQLAQVQSRLVSDWREDLAQAGPQWVRQALALDAETPVDSLGGSDYMVSIPQGPHQGQIAWVRWQLVLPGSMVTDLSPSDWEVLAPYTPQVERGEGPTPPASLAPPEGVAEAGWQVIGQETVRQSAHLNPPAASVNNWSFATGHIRRLEAMPQDGHYENEVTAASFKRQEEFHWCAGDYDAWGTVVYYRPLSPD